MTKNHKRLFIIVCALICLSSALFSMTGCSSVEKYKKINSEAESAVNRSNATIIVNAINNHNALCDEGKQILELPKTKDELDELELVMPIVMENDDYQNALTIIAFDDEGEAYVIEEEKK